jgi:hypothetical protein
LSEEDAVTERTQVLGNVFVGVLLGGALGYLCLTEDGRRLLARAEPWLDDVMDQMRRLQTAAVKARNAVDEGRQSVDVVMRLAGYGQKPSDVLQ